MVSVQGADPFEMFKTMFGDEDLHGASSGFRSSSGGNSFTFSFSSGGTGGGMPGMGGSGARMGDRRTQSQGMHNVPVTGVTHYPVST